MHVDDGALLARLQRDFPHEVEVCALRGRFEILRDDLRVGSVWRAFHGFAIDSDHSMA